MRKTFLFTVAASAIGAASLWAASAQAQSISTDDMTALSQKAAYTAQSGEHMKTKKHPAKRHEATVQQRRHYAQQPYYRGGYAQRAPMPGYYSPMNPYGYEYGYDPRAVDITATGSIMGGPYQPAWGDTPGQSWISYCSAKFPTYDRTSNTYWGPDGRQYLCH